MKLTGESPGVFVDVMNGNSVLVIGRASGIRVDTITFRAAIESGAGVVMLAGADDVAFFDCGMENREARRVIGIEVERTDRLRIEASTIRSVEVGIRFLGYCELPVVAGNRIEPGGQREGTLPIAILAEGAGSPITVTGNSILDAAFGIIINDAFPFGEPTSFAQGSIVLDNLLVMPPFPRGDAERLIAIDVAADFCRISGNRIGLTSADHLAIRATGSDTIVNENIILSQRRGGDELRLPVGIQIGFEGEAGGSPTTEVVVADNRLDGQMHGILAIQARNVAIHDNSVVHERGVFNLGISLNRTQNAAVTGNRIGGAFLALGSLSGRANRFADNDVSSAAAGMFLALEAEPAVSTNRIHDTTLFGVFGMFLIGRSDFVENRLTACANQTRLAIGLGVLLVIGELHVEANEVMNTGMTPDNNLQAGRTIGIFGGFVLEARIESNLVTHTDALQRDPQREDRALLLGGLFEFSVAFAPDSFVFGFPVQITANKFIGTGRRALVELVQFPINDNLALRFERVFFNENYCSHVSTEFNDDGRATVFLVGRAAVVMSNQIKATMPRFPSVNFNGMRGPFIGNITRGGAIGHVDFPAPENAFNQTM